MEEVCLPRPVRLLGPPLGRLTAAASVTRGLWDRGDLLSYGLPLFCFCPERQATLVDSGTVTQRPLRSTGHPLGWEVIFFF